MTPERRAELRELIGRSGDGFIPDELTWAELESLLAADEENELMKAKLALAGKTHLPGCPKWMCGLCFHHLQGFDVVAARDIEV